MNSEMRLAQRPSVAVLFALLFVAVLAGCSTYRSRGIDDTGKATEVVFPDVSRDATLNEGTFPNIENLRLVGRGATKDQLYGLIGRPHFREGLFGVREWDYIFNFRSGGGITRCQYKVIFDINHQAQSFLWKPAQCRDLLEPKMMEQFARMSYSKLRELVPNKCASLWTDNGKLHMPILVRPSHAGLTDA